MRKKSIYLIRLFLIIISLIILSSCKEDIVNPSSGNYIGPPRFHWKIDTLAPTTCDMLILDTNNYFTISNYIYFGEVHHFKNGIRTDYYTNFYATSLDGTDENNIYIGGCGTIGSNFYNYPTLTKFSNGSFTNINTGCDTADENKVTSIKIINNNIWGVTYRGEAFKYNGVNTTYYRIDTNYYSFLIANDIYNNVYMFLYQRIDSAGLPIAGNIKVVKLNDNNWNVIYACKSTNSDHYNFYKGNEKRIFCARDNYSGYIGTYDFSLGNFSFIVNDNSYDIHSNRIGGNSFNNLLLICPTEEDWSFYHWNGIVFSNEDTNIKNKGILSLCDIMKITEIKNRFFVLFWDWGVTERSYLVKTIY
jgi:hypothetical protein